MIRSGSIIKHVRAMDVAFHVDKVRGPYGPSGAIEITGEWINMAFVCSFNIGERQKIRLTREEAKSWKVCLTPNVQCLRNATWSE